MGPSHPSARRTGALITGAGIAPLPALTDFAAAAPAFGAGASDLPAFLAGFAAFFATAGFFAGFAAVFAAFLAGFFVVWGLRAAGFAFFLANAVSLRRERPRLPARPDRVNPNPCNSYWFSRLKCAMQAL
jgi:hypothetical protein